MEKEKSMKMKKVQIEIFKCVNCKESFPRALRPRPGRKVAGIRQCRCKTCSPRCSKNYNKRRHLA